MLWASWVVEGVEHRVFHSGDTGHGPHFKTIGEGRGPIDPSLTKTGDYGNDVAWESIHLAPEDSLRAHADLGADTLLPILWGTFGLSYHDRDEPIRRATQAAAKSCALMVTLRLGETFSVGGPLQSDAWWETIVSRNRQASTLLYELASQLLSACMNPVHPSRTTGLRCAPSARALAPLIGRRASMLWSRHETTAQRALRADKYR